MKQNGKKKINEGRNVGCYNKQTPNIQGI